MATKIVSLPELVELVKGAVADGGARVTVQRHGDWLEWLQSLPEGRLAHYKRGPRGSQFSVVAPDGAIVESAATFSFDPF